MLIDNPACSNSLSHSLARDRSEYPGEECQGRRQNNGLQATELGCGESNAMIFKVFILDGLCLPLVYPSCDHRQLRRSLLTPEIWKYTS